MSKLDKPKKPYSHQEYLKDLEAYGAKYEPSPYNESQFHIELDIEKLPGFSAGTLPYLQSTVDSMIEYLGYPTISDSFNDHAERREWRSGMSPEFKLLSQRNKLKAANLYSIQTWVEHIAGLPEIRSPQNATTEALASLIREAPDLSGYDDKSLDEKLQTVKMMDDFCQKFLMLVTKPTADIV